MNPTDYIQHYYKCTPYDSGSGFDLLSENFVEFSNTLKFYANAELHVGICPYHFNWRIPIDVPL